jgi:glutamate/tyrosine decarboxylase-like PLP-dependent enzyme
VNSGAFDPLASIAERARNAGAWLHVDGAFGLVAAASPAHAALLEGHDLADSWAVDGHKWLNTPYDCGVAICRWPDSIRDAFAYSAAYLENGDVAPRNMVPELSRRARSIEMFAALCALGRNGLRDLVVRCCQHAQRFAAGLQTMGFEVLNDVVLNQCVATTGTPSQIQEIFEHVQASGEAWMSTTVWRRRTALRISVSSWATTTADVDRTLNAIGEAVSVVVGRRKAP